MDFLHWVVCLASVCSALSLLIFVLKCLKCRDKQQHQGWQTAAHRHCCETGQPFCGCARCTWMVVTPPPYLRQNANVAHARNNCWAWHFFCTSCRLWRMLTPQPKKSRAGTSVSTGLTPSVAAARFLHAVGGQSAKLPFRGFAPGKCTSLRTQGQFSWYLLLSPNLI